MMSDGHANLKYKFGNRKFWAEGYYVSTVALDEETIAKYIREQKRADIAPGRLGVKEYEDTFSGQGAGFTGTRRVKWPLGYTLCANNALCGWY